MHTPTHALVALALFGKPKRPKRNGVILLGSLLPDAFLYGFALYHIFISKIEMNIVWDDIYFERQNLLISGWVNSVPLYATLALFGLILTRIKTTRNWGIFTGLFALAALSHIALDVPVHTVDAYMHFLPVTEWVYNSPLSYWNPNEGARYVAIAETLIVIFAMSVLWVRFPKFFIRTILLLISIYYIVLLALHWYTYLL